MRALAVRQAEEGLALQSVVQLAGWTGSGGGAKHLVQSGQVLVNGIVERRRSHRLHAGDHVAFQGDEIELVNDGH